MPRVLAAFLVALSGLAAAGADDLRVRIKTGILIGAYEDGVRTFKNIPFAAPPIGIRRWVVGYFQPVVVKFEKT